MNRFLIGGGEILDFSKKANGGVPSNLDDTLIRSFKFVPLVQSIVYVLLVVLMVMAIMKMFNMRSPFNKRGIKSELDYINQVKRRDANILRANSIMRITTKIIEKTPLALTKSSHEYWQYNITRAGVKIPGGSRSMQATEFNAVVQLVTLILLGLNVIILLLFNSILGSVLIVFTLIVSSYCPMMVIRQIVKERDNEITANFADFYLMLHYVLLASSSTPLSGVMKSYNKTTSSEEMHRLIDSCIHHIDTYGEYEATRYIAKDYREIPEVGKLMRLIRQTNEGGDVKAELNGFRDELIDAKEYAIKLRMNKLVNKARLSFNVLLPVLLQVIMSAMSIYMSDLGLAKGLIG